MTQTTQWYSSGTRWCDQCEEHTPHEVEYSYNTSNYVYVRVERTCETCMTTHTTTEEMI